MTCKTVEDWATHLHPDTWSGALIILGLFLVAGLLLSHLIKRTIRLIEQRDHDNRLDRMAVAFLSKVAVGHDRDARPHDSRPKEVKTEFAKQLE